MCNLNILSFIQCNYEKEMTSTFTIHLVWWRAEWLHPREQKAKQILRGRLFEHLLCAAVFGLLTCTYLQLCGFATDPNLHSFGFALISLLMTVVEKPHNVVPGFFVILALRFGHRWWQCHRSKTFHCIVLTKHRCGSLYLHLHHISELKSYPGAECR